MGYCTVNEVREGLVYHYWKPSQVAKKITDDGFTINVATNPPTFADEAPFLQTFIDRSANYIDTYGGPFAASSVLKDINRALAIYAAEQYIASGLGERTLSISIVSEQKRVLGLLEQIYKGTLPVQPLNPPDPSQDIDGNQFRVAPSAQDAALQLDDIEELWTPNTSSPQFGFLVDVDDDAPGAPL